MAQGWLIRLLQHFRWLRWYMPLSRMLALAWDAGSGTTTSHSRQAGPAATVLQQASQWPLAISQVDVHASVMAMSESCVSQSVLSGQ